MTYHFYQILSTFNKLKIILKVGHDNWKKAKTIYKFYKKSLKIPKG